MSSVNAQVYSREASVVIMAKVQVNVEGIRLFVNEEQATVTITTKEAIEGYQQTDDGSFVRAEVNRFSMNRAAFTRDICEADDLVADYRATRESGFDQKSLALIFRGSTMTIERTEHKANEEIVDEDGVVVKDSEGNVCTYKRDCFTTKIIGVRLTSQARARLDAALVL